MKDIPLLDPVTELKKLFDAKKFDASIEFCQKLFTALCPIKSSLKIYPANIAPIESKTKGINITKEDS